jgi:hypothetical protein
LRGPLELGIPVGERSLGLLESAKLCGKRAKQDGEPDDRTEGANCDHYRLAAPRSESHVFRDAHGDDDWIFTEGLDRNDARDPA